VMTDDQPKRNRTIVQLPGHSVGFVQSVIESANDAVPLNVVGAPPYPTSPTSVYLRPEPLSQWLPVHSRPAWHSHSIHGEWTP